MAAICTYMSQSVATQYNQGLYTKLLTIVK